MCAPVYLCVCLCTTIQVSSSSSSFILSDSLSSSFLFLPVDTVHQDAVMLCATGSSEPER